jgi:hypothetical protein
VLFRLGEVFGGFSLSFTVSRASTASVGLVLRGCYSQLEAVKSGETSAALSECSRGSAEGKKIRRMRSSNLRSLDREGPVVESWNFIFEFGVSGTPARLESNLR